MTETSKLTIDTFSPSEESLNFAKIYRETHGQEALDLLYRFKIIEDLLKRKQRPHMFIQIVKNFLFSTSSQDPNKFHFEIARMSLSLIKEEKHDNYAIDMLARALVESCNKLEKELKTPDVLLNLKIECKKKDPDSKEDISYYLDFVECHEAHEEFEKQFFEKNGLSIWDNKYLRLLNTLGSEGKKRAKEQTDKLERG